jgi:hypothetical protein
MISGPMVCLAKTMHLSCTDTNTVSKWTETRFHKDLRHLVVPSSAFKMISEAVVHLVQTEHLSCVKIRTISERTKSSFHLSLIT